MSQNLVVGPINKGKNTDRLPFNIDKDSFPILHNAYQWRGRVKRKRGTSALGRLLRSINSSTIQTSGAGTFDGNLLTGLETNASLANTAITIGADIFTLTNPLTGGLTGSTGGSGTINFTTGAFTITGAPASTNIQFNYFPDLPVMGIEDLTVVSTQFSSNLAFDTKYSYNISPLYPFTIYDVSYYKNPTSFGSYVQKTVVTPLTWNGQDYQQFWSTNYEGAFWVTNGIKITNGNADLTGVGMQFANAASITYISNTATTLTVEITGGPLVIGDYVYANEWGVGTGLNNQTGYVTTATINTPVPGTETVIITFPNATISVSAWVPGILQYLTNRSAPTKDCIRWYDGDPTSGVLPPVLVAGFGWVNFMPPLSNLNYSIGDAPPAVYYLVGCKLLIEFQDRLLCFGPVIQASTGTPIYLQDTVVFSENGTPYYTNSYTNSPLATKDNPTGPFYTNLISLLVPNNQIALPSAWFEDSTGFGGYKSAGIAQPINLVARNRDALMVEFDKSVSRLIYTGDDISPFNFYQTNAEYGCGSTFSGIDMDEFVLSRGKRGFIAANQSEVKRFDLDIPEAAFKVNLRNNGSERVTAVRDYINEWIYFTYCSVQAGVTYPNQTLFYNYQDQSWGVFNESYTTYGLFRPQSGFTWATLINTVLTWDTWDDTWTTGSDSLFQTQVLAGNQQGFIVIREDALTSEAPSLYIQSMTTNIITSPSHNLNQDDYIVINGMTGTSGAIFNGMVFQISVKDANSFAIETSIGVSTYLGLGTITRVYNPLIQTKQFNEAWSIGRKTRIGPQMYLLSATNNSQITLQIYLSQDSANVWNAGSVVPANNPPPVNNGLIYSQVLFTCAESTNLGLTPANTNLQMLAKPGNAPNVGGSSQSGQIFHRVNTSLIGDTIQFGFTMSDAQLKDPTLANQFAEIELHGFIVDISQSGLLA
jgi:hypothetical protein